MLHHVATQVTRVYASIIALVTLEWLVSSMHPHYVLFHITSVNSRMLWEQVLLRVSIATFVALERLRPRVLHHVATQVTRVYASIIALVTLGWLFSSMHPHHMLFQITSCNVVKLTSCAYMWKLKC